MGRAVLRRTASMITGPMVISGTNRPSITSTWMASAPPRSAAPTCSPSRDHELDTGQFLIRTRRRLRLRGHQGGRRWCGFFARTYGDGHADGIVGTHLRPRPRGLVDYDAGLDVRGRRVANFREGGPHILQ